MFPCESEARNVSPRVATSQSPLHATPLTPARASTFY